MLSLRKTVLENPWEFWKSISGSKKYFMGSHIF
jgi:hypothetical protein